MKELLGNAISSELIFVYGLIALVILLIVVIVIIDRRERKKKPKSLFDTLNMKIIANPDDLSEEKKVIHSEQQSVTTQPEILEIKQQPKEVNFQDLEPLPEVKTIATSDPTEENFRQSQNHAELKSSTPAVEHDSQDFYVETDLEKTQAQIRVEEITNALKNAQVEEHIQEDKYAKFEEEQERNAIISYNELKESFDKLYSENEKIQYLEDDEIPINIEELYQLQDHNSKPKVVEEKVSKPEPQTTSTFKSSPLISPVYGIQKPPVEIEPTVDPEIQNANQFLQSLKELKNNLD